jgi:hypothetical protein
MRLLSYIVVAFVSILPVGVRPAQTIARSSGSMAIPAQYEDGRLYVPVSLQRAGGVGADSIALGWFILDTGAQATLIDTDVARRLQLTVYDGGLDRGAGAGSLREGKTRGLRLRVGPVPFAAREIVVAPLDSLLAPSSGRHVAGIVGSQFFEEHAIDIAPPSTSVVVDRPSVPPARNDRAVVLPIELRNSMPYIHGVLRLKPHPSGLPPLRLLVDLGAKAPLLLTEHALALAGGEATLSPHILASLGAGVGGETRYFFTRANRLVLGDPGNSVSADSLPVGFSARGTLRATAFDGLLGAPFLSRYHVRFDYANRRLTLFDDAGNQDAIADFDQSGLFLTTGGTRAMDRLVVRRVVSGSAADRANVRPGDALLTVNGRSVTELSLVSIRRILRGGSGQVVRLTLLRGRRRLSPTITLRALI